MSPLGPQAWCLFARRILALATLVGGWMLFPSWSGATTFDPRKALLHGDALDYSNQTEWRVIEAKWIRDAVEHHVKVDVRYAVIQGDLNLHYVQSEKEISLVNCEFTGALDASYALFKQKLILDNSSFAKGADFTSAQFAYDASLNDTEFTAEDQEQIPWVRFSFAQVKGSLSMANARFGEGVKLDANSALIEKGAFFRGCRLHGAADFQAANLGMVADFKGAVFYKEANFAGSIIGGEALFQGVEFYGDVNFNVIQVKQAAFFNSRQTDDEDFWAAIFHARADFGDSHFGASVFLAGVWFQGEANFNAAEVKGDFIADHDPRKGERNVRFEKDASFAGLEVSKMMTFRDAEFKGKANFNGSHVVDTSIFVGTTFDGATSFLESRNDNTLAFENAVFRGELDAGGSLVHGALVLAGATCKGPAKFSSVKVDGETSLSKGAFEQGIYFDQAHFGKNLDFSAVTCYGETNLAAVTVEGRSNFIGATFNGNLQFSEGALHQILFSNVTCHQRANFALSQFKGNADFHESHFMNEVLFQKCNIDGDLNFFGSHFDGFTDFTLSTISGIASFANTRFDSDLIMAAFHGGLGAVFTGTRFLKNVRFDGAHFSALTVFDNTEFFGRASFREAAFSYISFLPETPEEQNVVRSRRPPFPLPEIAKKPANFRGPLDLRECSYDRIWGEWPKMLAQMSPYDRGPYVQLEKVFAAAGESERADSVYLARQKAESNEMWKRHQYGAWLFSKLYGIVANYGVRPYRLLTVSAILVILGTLFFREPTRVRRAEKEPAEPVPTLASWTEWDAFRLTVRYFLPIEIAMGSRWKANDEAVPIQFRLFSPPWHWHVQPSTVATILQISGWILVPLGLAALTGLLRIKAG